MEEVKLHVGILRGTQWFRLVFEHDTGSVHKEELHREEKGRRLLLFRLKEMFPKPKVISSQAVCNRASRLPTCV